MPLRFRHIRTLAALAAGTSTPRACADSTTAETDEYFRLGNATSSHTSTAQHTFARREHATRLLTLAAAVEPVETAYALKVARHAVVRLAHNSIDSASSASLHPSDVHFLRRTARDAASRAVAGALGAAAAVYAALTLVTTSAPIIVVRIAVATTAAVALVSELVPASDIATVELLLLPDSCLARRARRSIEQYNPDLFLLGTLDRHTLCNDLMGTQSQQQNAHCDVDFDEADASRWQ